MTNDRHDERDKRREDDALRQGKPPSPRELAPHEDPTGPDYAQRRPDRVEQASMDSFPCSDPPGYYNSRG